MAKWFVFLFLVLSAIVLMLWILMGAKQAEPIPMADWIQSHPEATAVAYRRMVVGDTDREIHKAVASDYRRRGLNFILSEPLQKKETIQRMHQQILEYEMLAYEYNCEFTVQALNAYPDLVRFGKYEPPWSDDASVHRVQEK